MKISTGTKSVLFGVHQFLWHPWTVGLAWRSLYKVWPRWHEWVAIFCHDLGYWGCPNMDGLSGRKHPIKGADMARTTVFKLTGWSITLRHPIRTWLDSGFQFQSWQKSMWFAAETYRLCIGHSQHYAKEFNVEISKLFRADKACILFDPESFYLCRAIASGELWEYLRNAPLPLGATPRQWHRWYRAKVSELL